RFETMADVPTQTPQSQAMSKALKNEGFKFCGPTICYAFMQAVGMVNDHLIDCPRHAAVAQLWRRMRRNELSPAAKSPTF
ncbi:MAG: DNA-3-methyladenine glycosylase I, partial [Pseudomonadota bacterium]